MTSFRDVISSCKYDDNNQVELSNQRNHRNEMESALEYKFAGWDEGSSFFDVM